MRRADYKSLAWIAGIIAAAIVVQYWVDIGTREERVAIAIVLGIALVILLTRPRAQFAWLMMLALVTVSCGDSPSGPDGTHTQALVIANDSWRLSSDGRTWNGTWHGTPGEVIDLGAGRRCATARLLFGRPLPWPPGQSASLTVTVGRTSQTVRTGDEITVCGSGQVS